MDIYKKLICRLCLIILLLCFGVCNLVYAQTQDTLLVHYDVFKCDSIIQANAENPDFVILDVRTASEYLPDHLVGALNRDYYASNFSQLLDALPRDKMYLIHCLSGGRSGIAFNMMYGMNFTWVVDMQGGINAWKSASFPTTSNFAPLLMAVSDTIISNDTIIIGTIDTIALKITNRANDTLRFNTISSLSGTEFSTDFDTNTNLQGAEDYSFSIFYEPIDEISDTLIFVIESNGGAIAFYISRSGKLLVGVSDKYAVAELSIYPNPASAVLVFAGDEFSLPGSILSIFDIGGKEIFSKTMPELVNPHSLDVSFLQEGIYIITILSSEGLMRSKKIFIVR